jgi:DNA-binding NarL/FixJ family response regulator
MKEKQGRVLLADRHQNMLEGVRSLLETAFDVVVMVADEKSLIDSIDKVKPDLVIVDLSLPVSKEVNVAQRIMNISPEMKVIILSVHDEQAAVDECMAAGASGFVLKRTAVNDLIPAIWEVRKGRIYVSPSVEMEK